MHKFHSISQKFPSIKNFTASFKTDTVNIATRITKRTVRVRSDLVTGRKRLSSIKHIFKERVSKTPNNLFFQLWIFFNCSSFPAPFAPGDVSRRAVLRGRLVAAAAGPSGPPPQGSRARAGSVSP